MMGDASALAGGRFGGADVQPVIDLHGIHRNDLAGELFGQEKGDFRFADGSGAGQKEGLHREPDRKIEDEDEEEEEVLSSSCIFGGGTGRTRQETEEEQAGGQDEDADQMGGGNPAAEVALIRRIIAAEQFH